MRAALVDAAAEDPVERRVERVQRLVVGKHAVEKREGLGIARATADAERDEGVGMHGRIARFELIAIENEQHVGALVAGAVTQPGAAPRSLGVLGSEDYTVQATLASYDPAVINNATYGISLEPLGGSPTGQPTGPVIHAKLLQVTPPQNP